MIHPVASRNPAISEIIRILCVRSPFISILTRPRWGCRCLPGRNFSLLLVPPVMPRIPSTGTQPTAKTVPKYIKLSLGNLGDRAESRRQKRVNWLEAGSLGVAGGLPTTTHDYLSAKKAQGQALSPPLRF